MKLSDVKKLHQKKFRTQFGFYLVEGEHLVLELINVAQHDSSTLGDITLYVTADYETWLKEKLDSSRRRARLE